MGILQKQQRNGIDYDAQFGALAYYSMRPLMYQQLEEAEAPLQMLPDTFKHFKDCACASCARSEKQRLDPGPYPTQIYWPCHDCGLDYIDEKHYYKYWNANSQAEWKAYDNGLCGYCAELAEITAENNKAIELYDSTPLPLRYSPEKVAAVALVFVVSTFYLFSMVFGLLI